MFKINKGFSEYSFINNFFNIFGNSAKEDFFNGLFLKYDNIDKLAKEKSSFIKELSDYFNKFNKDIDSVPYIEATVNQFIENKAFGEKKIISLERILKDKYLYYNLSLLPKEKFLKKIMYSYISQIKQHTFLWLYYALKTDYQTYKKAKIVIPAVFIIDNNEKSFNFNKLYYFKKTDLSHIFKLKKKDYEEFHGQWQMNKEWMYAKRFINKYFLKLKNKQGIEKIIDTPIGTFFEVKDDYEIFGNKYFYYGETKEFIKHFKIQK